MTLDRPISDWSANDWADFWRYVIGVNVIPANTQEKKVSVNWKGYQNDPISDEQHIKWKDEGAFKYGLAIIAGKAWHNPTKKDLWIICVDCDNQKAIDEFCTTNGHKISMGELGEKVIVEQHFNSREIR